jgi:hypothetical protein
MAKIFNGHECEKCLTHITVFEAVCSKKEKKQIQRKVAENLKSSEDKMKSRENTCKRVEAFCLQQDPLASHNHQMKMGAAHLQIEDTTEDTVAQKTAPMFAHFGKIGMV